MMTPTEIRISNMAGIEKQTIPCRRITTLTGRNGTGKTTVIRLIQQSLFGKCSDHTGGKMQLRDLAGGEEIKPGVISIDWAGSDRPVTTRYTIQGAKTELSILLGKRWHISGDGCSQEDIRAMLWNEFGIDRNRQEAAVFCQAALDNIAEYFRSDVCEADVMVAAADKEKRLKEWLEDSGIKIRSAADLDAIGKTAEVMRRPLNKQLKADQQRLADTTGDNYPVVKERTLTDPKAVEENIRKLEAQSQKLSEQIGAQKGKKTFAEIKAEVETVSARLDEIADSVPELPPQPEPDGSAEMLAQAEAEHKRIQKDLDALKDVCPACERPFDADEVKAMREKLAAQLKDADARCAELKQRAQEAAQRQEDYARAVKRYEDIMEEDRLLRQRRDALNDETPKSDTGALENDREQLQERIARGRQVVDEIKRANAREILAEKVSEALNEKTFLDWLCDNFRGKMQSELVRGEQENFLALCNVALRPVGISLALTDDMPPCLTATKDGKRPVSYRLLSTGERCYISQVAASQLCPGGLVIVDNVDNLDGDRRKRFQSSLSEGNAYLLAVADPDGESKSSIIGDASIVSLNNKTGE